MENKDKKVYSFIATPYSGKTTLRKELVKRYGFKYVSVDDYISEHNLNPSDMTYEEWSTAYRLAYNSLREYLRSGETVIVDIGNPKKSERELVERIAKEEGASFVQIYLKTPLEITKARRLKNLETKERGHVDDAGFKAALEMFEAPAEDEKYIELTPDINLEKWMKENIGPWKN